MLKKRKVYLPLLIVILTASAVFIYYKRKGDKDETIITEKVKRGELVITVEADGVIVPEKKVDIRSKIQGRIQSIFVAEGRKVNPGDLIVRIAPDEFQARHEEFLANLQIAAASLREMKLTASLEETQDQNKIAQTEKMLQQEKLKLQDAKRSYERLNQLNDSKLVSQSDIDEAKVSYDLARSKHDEIKNQYKLAVENFSFGKNINRQKIKLSQARVQNAKAQLKAARENLNNTSIFSPMYGMVTYLGVEVGDMIAPEQMGKASGTIIATVSDLSSLFVDTRVNEVDIGMVKVGQMADIIVDAFPDNNIHGKIQTIGLQALEQKESGAALFFVEIKVLNPGSRLKPGMNCKVKIQAASVKNTLYVPIETITKEGLKDYVRVKVQDKVVKRFVKSGMSNVNFTQILSGLKEGEEIVLPLPQIPKKQR